MPPFCMGCKMELWDGMHGGYGINVGMSVVWRKLYPLWGEIAMPNWEGARICEPFITTTHGPPFGRPHVGKLASSERALFPRSWTAVDGCLVCVIAEIEVAELMTAVGPGKEDLVGLNVICGGIIRVGIHVIAW
jgi:hypothetical protein